MTPKVTDAQVMCHRRPALRPVRASTPVSSDTDISLDLSREEREDPTFRPQDLEARDVDREQYM